METLDLVQGSPAWHQHRATHYNASDAPAAMGISPYKTRTELLSERHTGMAREVDSATQALFDAGHRYEQLARALAEEIIGEELYPVTGCNGKLSASFDGLTMDESIAWEHKSINADIRAAKCAADLGEHLRVQMEQQLLVSGAGKCLFTASQWDASGKLIEEVHFWYAPDLALRERLVAAWKQFEKDLAEYTPTVDAPKPQAEAIMQLPALSIQIRGEVTLSNLSQFKERAEAFIANIKTEFSTDQDFADAEETVKFCERAEKNIELAKQAAIAQTASIDELMRTMDYIKEQLRSKRLSLDKLVSTRKEQIKAEILNGGKEAFSKHIAALEAEITPIRLNAPFPDFGAAMKNKRTLASLRDAVNTALADGKIAADASARLVRSNLAYLREHAANHLFLFNDQQQIIFKAEDDFKMLVGARVAEHEKKEKERMDFLLAERARIQAEEQAKAQAPKQTTVQVELDDAPSIPMSRIVTPPNTPPNLRLGQIGERLGFNVTADFLRSLGIQPAGKDKVAVLYHEENFNTICDAIVVHIYAVQRNRVA